eukprot:SAG25_NODE_338_length_9538_cov_22.622630_11_plen_849_part_00
MESSLTAPDGMAKTPKHVIDALVAAEDAQDFAARLATLSGLGASQQDNDSGLARLQEQLETNNAKALLTDARFRGLQFRGGSADNFEELTADIEAHFRDVNTEPYTSPALCGPVDQLATFLSNRNGEECCCCGELEMCGWCLIKVLQSPWYCFWNVTECHRGACSCAMRADLIKHCKDQHLVLGLFMGDSSGAIKKHHRWLMFMCYLTWHYVASLVVGELEPVFSLPDCVTCPVFREVPANGHGDFTPAELGIPPFSADGLDRCPGTAYGSSYLYMPFLPDCEGCPRTQSFDTFFPLASYSGVFASVAHIGPIPPEQEYDNRDYREEREKGYDPALGTDIRQSCCMDPKLAVSLEYGGGGHYTLPPPPSGVPECTPNQGVTAARHSYVENPNPAGCCTYGCNPSTNERNCQVLRPDTGCQIPEPTVCSRKYAWQPYAGKYDENYGNFCHDNDYNMRGHGGQCVDRDKSIVHNDSGAYWGECNDIDAPGGERSIWKSNNPNGTNAQFAECAAQECPRIRCFDAYTSSPRADLPNGNVTPPLAWGGDVICCGPARRMLDSWALIHNSWHSTWFLSLCDMLFRFVVINVPAQYVSRNFVRLAFTCPSQIGKQGDSATCIRRLGCAAGTVVAILSSAVLLSVVFGLVVVETNSAAHVPTGIVEKFLVAIAPKDRMDPLGRPVTLKEMELRINNLSGPWVRALLVSELKWFLETALKDFNPLCTFYMFPFAKRSAAIFILGVVVFVFNMMDFVNGSVMNPTRGGLIDTGLLPALWCILLFVGVMFSPRFSRHRECCSEAPPGELDILAGKTEAYLTIGKWTLERNQAINKIRQHAVVTPHRPISSSNPVFEQQ